MKPDLACERDPGELNKLPADEKNFTFWAELTAVPISLGNEWDSLLFPSTPYSATLLLTPSSPSRIRTYNKPVNSRLLYR